MQEKLSMLREKRATDDNGFTLIELLVVVVILGVLIAIAIPVYLNYRKGANDAAAKSDVRNAISVLETCNSDNNSYPSAVSSAGVITGCTGQSIKLSTDSSLNYAATGTSPTTSYVLVATNSSGNGKFWCYNSAKGGSVAASTTASATLTTATC